MAKETIASMAVRLGIDLSGWDKDAKEFQKTFGKLGGQLQNAGTKIGVSFTAAGASIAAGLGFAVNKAMDFDAEMSRVGAIAGATSGDLDAMRQSALDLGANTSKSASEVATGMELMAAKGYDATQVIAAMPGVIAASEASGEDMALVADTVSSALNAFGLEAKDASRVADVLAMSANTSAAGVDDLQYAFKYAAPVANSLEISMEQLAAATGIMADSGMKGEQAGTTLRSALLRLADPTKEAKKAMDSLGLSVTDAQGNFRPFDQIIAQLNTSTASMTDAQKAAALSTIFGKEAMSGMLSLVEAGPEKFNALTTGLENSGGASAEAAAKMKDNLAGSMEELSGAVETLQIGLGSALSPAIRAVADALTGVANWFNSLSPQTQKYIAIGAALAAGLLVLVGVVGFMVAALGFLAAAEWAVILPIAGIIAAVVAVMAVIAALAYLIYANWDQIKAVTITVWNAISGALTAAWNWIVDTFNRFWSIIGGVVVAGWEFIKAYYVAAFNIIKATVETAWNSIVTLFKAAFDTFMAVISAGWELIKAYFAAAFLTIYYLVTGQWGKIGDVWAGFMDKVKAITGEFWDKVKGIWSNAWVKLGSILSEGWNNVKNVFNEGLKNVVSAAKNFGTEWLNIGKDIVMGMVNGIKSVASSIASAAMDAVKGAVDAAKNFLGINSPSKLFMEIGGYTGEGFAIGLDNSAEMVTGAAQNMAAVPLSGVADVAYNTPTFNTNGPSAAPTTIIMEMDGKEIARKTFDRMGGTLRIRGAVT